MFLKKDHAVSFLMPMVIICGRPKKAKDDDDDLFNEDEEIVFDGTDEDLKEFEETENLDDEY